jgi:hypothetical protein
MLFREKHNNWLSRAFLIGVLLFVIAAFNNNQTNDAQSLQQDVISLTESNSSAILITPLDFPKYNLNWISIDFEQPKQNLSIYISDFAVNQIVNIAYKVYSERYLSIKKYTLNTIKVFNYYTHSFSDYPPVS